jgi:hypothetical protein
MKYEKSQNIDFQWPQPEMRGRTQMMLDQKHLEMKWRRTCKFKAHSLKYEKSYNMRNLQCYSSQPQIRERSQPEIWVKKKTAHSLKFDGGKGSSHPEMRVREQMMLDQKHPEMKWRRSRNEVHPYSKGRLEGLVTCCHLLGFWCWELHEPCARDIPHHA